MSPVDILIIGLVLGVAIGYFAGELFKRPTYGPTFSSFGGREDYKSLRQKEMERSQRFARLRQQYQPQHNFQRDLVKEFKNNPSLFSRMFNFDFITAEKKEGKLIEVDFVSKKRKAP